MAAAMRCKVCSVFVAKAAERGRCVYGENLASSFAEVRACKSAAVRGAARGSVHLLCALVASGPFLGIFPNSLLRFGANLPSLKILPVELPMPPLPVGIMTLKNRTVSPVARLFIDCAREVAKPLAKRK
jgi:DNA-binding transcriptional LysR family regulator